MAEKRNSNEIILDIFNLLKELQESREYEQKLEKNRLDSLENRLSKQEDRLKNMAKNLLGQE